MIRFSAFKLLAENATPDLLLENRIEFLKNQHKEIDTSHDPNGVHKDAGAIIDHFAAADPTEKKAYTQWIVNQYRKKNIRQEDFERVRDVVQNFDRYRARLPNKDINQYKHINDVETAVELYLNTAASNKEAKRNIKTEGADLVHDGPELMIHHIKTHEAACLYGAGTKWCTASRNAPQTFQQYASKGPIYVMQDKSTGQKHQMHFETDQIMDETDRPANLVGLVHRYPELKTVQRFKDSPYASFFASSPAEFEAGIVKMNANPRGWAPEEEHLAQLIDSPYMTDQHYQKIHNYYNKQALPANFYTVNKLSHAIKDSINQAPIKAAFKYSTQPQIIAAAAEKTDDQHTINKFYTGNNLDLRTAVVKNPHLPIEKHSEILTKQSPVVRRALVENPKLSADSRSRLLSDKSPTVRAAAVEHMPNLTVNDLHRVMSTETSRAPAQAAVNRIVDKLHSTETIDSDTINNIIKSAVTHTKISNWDRTRLIENVMRSKHAHNINGDAVDTILNSNDARTRASAFFRPNHNSENHTPRLGGVMTTSRLYRGLQDKDIIVRHAASFDENITGDHITHILNNPKQFKPDVRRNVLWVNRNVLTPEHLQQAKRDKATSVANVAWDIDP